MLPFSILESIPAEIPAVAPSSVMVSDIDLRSRRTSRPMIASSGRAESSRGAFRASAKAPIRSLLAQPRFELRRSALSK